MLDMQDLMIVLNAPASKKNGFVVLDTYYTKQASINKAGKYKGGSITPADVLNCLPVGNSDCETIKRLFSELVYPVATNRFYITIDNLQKLHNILKKCQILFMDNTDKAIVHIEEISSVAINKKPKYQYSIENYDLYYYTNQVLSIKRTGSRMPNINQSEPTPRIHYFKEESVYSLFFDYEGIQIPYLDKRISIRVNDVIYLRNIRFENTINEILRKQHFVKLAQCRYVYSGHKNRASLNNALSSSGIILEDDENTFTPSIKVTRSSSGWFEIDLSCDFGGDIIDLSSKIDLFANKNEIEIDGKKVILPESIIAAKDNILVKENKLIINQRSIFHLLHIIYDSDSEITDFFSYSDVYLDLPNSFVEAAFPYQIDGIKWLKFLFLNRLGGCLADDMGLGKTFQIIAFLSDLEVRKSVSKVLIVVPRTLLSNWKKEFEKFSSLHSIGIYHRDRRDKVDFEFCDIIITTYHTAYLDVEKLNQIGFTLIIFDEIQMIKNRKSVISSTMKQFHTDIRIGLSGTPMENNISELWNIMDILNPGVLSSHASFMARYNGRNYDELKNILNVFILRRMKKDVLKELPPKYEQIIYCDMDQNQRRLYAGISVAVKSMIMNLKAFAAPVVLKGLTLLRECCCHPLLLDETTNVEHITESCKLDALKILVDNLFASGHKILIFSNYTSMLQIIEAELEKNESYKSAIFYLDGQTKNRAELVARFESAPEGIFLISIKAGGVGLNLVSAQDVIIYDPWWNPFVEQQAIDRAYRIGQERAISVYKLVAANTLEEKIIDMQASKERDFDKLINGLSMDKSIDLNKIISLL